METTNTTLPKWLKVIMIIRAAISILLGIIVLMGTVSTLLIFITLSENFDPTALYNYLFLTALSPFVFAYGLIKEKLWLIPASILYIIMAAATGVVYPELGIQLFAIVLNLVFLFIFMRYKQVLKGSMFSPIPLLIILISGVFGIYTTKMVIENERSINEDPESAIEMTQ